MEKQSVAVKVQDGRIGTGDQLFLVSEGNTSSSFPTLILLGSLAKETFRLNRAQLADRPLGRAPSTGE